MDRASLYLDFKKHAKNIYKHAKVCKYQYIKALESERNSVLLEYSLPNNVVLCVAGKRLIKHYSEGNSYRFDHENKYNLLRLLVMNTLGFNWAVLLRKLHEQEHLKRLQEKPEENLG